MSKKKLARRSVKRPQNSEPPTAITSPESVRPPSIRLESSGESSSKNAALTPTNEKCEEMGGSDETSPDSQISIADGKAEKRTNPESEADTLEGRYREILSSIVSEKRSYDFLVNKVNRRLDEVTATKKKAQNQLVELNFSVSKLLKEIENIEMDPLTYDSPSAVPNAGLRGPPLPSQDELFMQAWENGQVTKAYSRFSQRYRS